jgi:GntR family transcriptional regulator
MSDARRLDREDPLPLWAQLEADLRRRLEAGELTERFPTDQELVAAYGVSRHTVREALRRLAAAGVLRRYRGRGSFVNPEALEQPLGALYSLFSSVEAQGLTQKSDVLALEVRADPEAAAALDEPPEAELVFLARLRHAGDEPLAVDRVWLPASVARPLLEVDFTRTALYDELAARCGVRVVGGSERIQPAHPDAADAARLGVTTDTPVFAVERRGRARERLVEYRRTIIRGDRYAFVADWGDGRPGGLRADAT